MTTSQSNILKVDPMDYVFHRKRKSYYYILSNNVILKCFDGEEFLDGEQAVIMPTGNLNEYCVYKNNFKPHDAIDIVHVQTSGEKLTNGTKVVCYRSKKDKMVFIRSSKEFTDDRFITFDMSDPSLAMEKALKLLSGEIKI